MLYLVEISYANDKESVAIYPNDNHPEYADETALLAEFEDKLGTAMNSDAIKAEMLIGFDSTGRILERQSGEDKRKAITYHVKTKEVTETVDGKEVTEIVPAASLSPRLITVKNQNGTEVANQSKKDSTTLLEGAWHKVMGSAMADATVKALLCMGVANEYVSFNDYWTRPTEPEEEQEQPEEVTE